MSYKWKWLQIKMTRNYVLWCIDIQSVNNLSNILIKVWANDGLILRFIHT